MPRKKKTVTIRFCLTCFKLGNAASQMDNMKSQARAGMWKCPVKKPLCGKVIHEG